MISATLISMTLLGFGILPLGRQHFASGKAKICLPEAKRCFPEGKIQSPSKVIDVFPDSKWDVRVMDRAVMTPVDHWSLAF